MSEIGLEMTKIDCQKIYFEKSLHVIIPQIQSIVGNGDGQKRLTFQTCSSVGFLKKIFFDN